MRRADHSSRGVIPIVVRRFVCDIETLKMRRPYPALSHSATEKNWGGRGTDNDANITYILYTLRLK